MFNWRRVVISNSPRNLPTQAQNAFRLNLVAIEFLSKPIVHCARDVGVLGNPTAVEPLWDCWHGVLRGHRRRFSLGERPRSLSGTQVPYSGLTQRWTAIDTANQSNAENMWHDLLVERSQVITFATLCWLVTSGAVHFKSKQRTRLFCEVSPYLISALSDFLTCFSPLFLTGVHRLLPPAD